MNTVFFLVLRQMRAPLLLLSLVYAIATIGLTLIPGIDDKGNVWYMDFFLAFYFVSYMGTTTGFGEIPHPFSDAQRMWALIFIYITVFTWIYTIGALISLLQSDALKRAITEYSFERRVRLIREPFCLVCGYGDTGSKLVGALRNRLMQATVIEIRQERVNALVLDDSPMYVPGLCGDAGDPDNLLLAGISNPFCEYVVAITNDNAVNLHIAITARVLNPGVKVICRADSHDVEANMASFGTNLIIDPYDAFAKNLGMATYAPYQFLLSEWFHGDTGIPMSEVMSVPTGRWVLCGFGRFGKSINDEMTSQGLDVKVIEPDQDIVNLPDNSIIGYGTEAVTLNEADIQNAVGIIAGTDNDSNNLSIVVTAKELKPDLFVIVRQNEHVNRPLFEKSGADVAMEPSKVIAGKIRSVLTNRSIDEFLSLARAHDDRWAKNLTERMRTLSNNVMPEVWEVTISEEDSYAVNQAIQNGEQVQIGHLIRDHFDRDELLSAICLFHANDLGAFCVPPIHTTLEIGDRLLFTGTRQALSKMKWNLQNEVALTYVMTGETLPQTAIGRWFRARAA